MLFRNFTPFPPLQFESRDENQNDFGVIVLRGSFTIVPSARLRLIPDQKPLVMADQYFGDPGQSSLHFESSIAPYKPTTDVVVTADAWSPTARPLPHWNVGISVDDIEKQFTVTGPRQWEKSLTGYRLRDAQPVTQVPIRYELAYGGTANQTGTAQTFDENPVGTGFVGSSTPDVIQAPQLLPLNMLNLPFGKPIDVVGLGPVAPAWSPRRQHAGTFNLVWEKTRWPDLPTDFSYRFYNTGSKGLVLPRFASGAETITLVNLTPESRLSFQLPCFQLATLLRFEDGRVLPGPIHLDTIHIELPQNQVYLTWRGVFPVNVPLRVLEVRMKAPPDVIETSSAS